MQENNPQQKLVIEKLRQSETANISRDAYFLSPESLDALEQQLVGTLRDGVSDDGTLCAVVSGSSELGNFCRTMENQVFRSYGEDYDFSETMAVYEDQSIFLYTVDMTSSKIAHCKRLVKSLPSEAQEQEQRTGIEIFDDRATATKKEEFVQLSEVLQYHGIDGVEDCINVTTNLKTKRVDKELSGLHLLTSYKGVYELVSALGLGYVITYQNRYAHSSLESLGVESELLCGGEYHLPNKALDGGYDKEYVALVLPRNEHNTRAFTEVDPDNELSPFIAELEVPLYAVDSNSGVSRLY